MNNYKKYKQSPPINTIYKIKEILSNIGILTKDVHYGQYPCFSCRISIGNSELSVLDIGTNGKGRTFEYSMASGYAEFAERLQNHMMLSLTKKKYATKKQLEKLPSDSLFVNNIIEKQLDLTYLYDMNEENWNIKEVLSLLKNDIMKLLCIVNEEELFDFFIRELKIEETTMVPFFSVSDNEERLLPIEILMAATGSSGMCAGNTREEALIQGFCEIFERFVAKQIYYNEIAPPDIPISYFEGTSVYDELNFIKNNLNIEIIIKDCSLQKEYPVVGILFIDKINQRYNFKLGADFVPHIALERCLTEILQGHENIPTLPLKIFDLKINTLRNQIEESIDYNLQKIYINHSGYWPISLFSNNPSYEFKGFNALYGKSDNEDIKHCINLINNQGYNIYIRDNSVLGFPAYYIVIPGFSQLITRKEHYDYYKKIFSDINLKELYSIDKNKARLLAESINKKYNLIKYFGFDYAKLLYLYNIDQDILGLEMELLAFMLFYYIGEIKQSKKFLDIFLEEKINDKQFYNYFFAISDFITLNYFNNLPKEETKSILQQFYGVSIAEKVISDYENPENSFDYYSFPNCFNCESCLVKENCSFEYILKIHKNIHYFAEKNQIKQINLRTLINNSIVS